MVMREVNSLCCIVLDVHLTLLGNPEHKSTRSSRRERRDARLSDPAGAPPTASMDLFRRGRKRHLIIVSAHDAGERERDIGRLSSSSDAPRKSTWHPGIRGPTEAETRVDCLIGFYTTCCGATLACSFQRVTPDETAETRGRQGRSFREDATSIRSQGRRRCPPSLVCSTVVE
ncbi:hypothetical protein LY76DRAFT_186142 [Colletotrichum caudatum]|nr:hypothetical protein LY76DRAFT_186142 [Colletotrichum caudatum]